MFLAGIAWSVEVAFSARDEAVGWERQTREVLFEVDLVDRI
jgi:hypothetical protein